MKDLLNKALSTAKLRGASYADIRLIDTRTEGLQTRNGVLSSVSDTHSLGFGIRVVANGSWGFASSNICTKEEVQRVAAQAVAIAKASATVKKKNVKLAKEPVYQDTWQTPYMINPFEIPIEQKLDLLFRVDKILRKKKEIAVAEGFMNFMREHQLMATSEGSYIDQLIMRSGGGFMVTAVGHGDTQVRSFPCSFRGQYLSGGYEVIESLRMEEYADRVRDEAISLLTAPACPSGKKDIILSGTQLCLQIHESCGHPTELDRVLGQEANFAGTSFLTTEKKGKFKYGSPIVNLVADGTVPGGLATVGYDDDAVRAQRWHLVKDGLFVGYQTTRETADECGDQRSYGCCRAQGFNNLPMTRNNNISLMPGEWTLEDLIADTKDGIYMDNNKSWSIDQQRLNFQFGTEIAWEIKNGKLGKILKNPTYQSITPEFWGACDAICNQDYWELWGVLNCGKGQPMQSAEMSHGSAPARFKKITVGVGSKK